MYMCDHVCRVFSFWFSFTVQDGISPLYIASQYGHTKVVDALLEKKADPNLDCMVHTGTVVISPCVLCISTLHAYH